MRPEGICFSSDGGKSEETQNQIGEVSMPAKKYRVTYGGWFDKKFSTLKEAKAEASIRGGYIYHYEKQELGNKYWWKLIKEY